MRSLLPLLFLVSVPALGSGGKPLVPGDTRPVMAASGFEENKGQVRTTTGDAAPFVRYRLTQGNTQLFLLSDGIAYQFSRMHYPAGYAELMADAGRDRKQLDALHEQVRLETYRMDMTLEGANPSTRITTEGRSTDYTQYYNHDALDVHTYTKVTYHEVYPGIDWVVYTTEKGMKYDFVVRPGADVNDIQLRFKHQEELSLTNDGGLVLGNRMGRITEAPPVSYQPGKKIGTRFILQGNRLGFDPGHYDRTKDLIIDPDLTWATYYGGESPNGTRASDVVVDGSGAVIMCGSTTSATGIAEGGHQDTFGGVWDGYLTKFNSDGVRLWGTYYGGEGSDVISNCTLDPQGNILFSGTTDSQSNIALNGHQNSFTGDGTLFLVKMNASGERIWGTYYGNQDALGSNSTPRCAVDDDGNVYLAGYATAGTGYSTPGSFQPTHNGGQDAFLAKFTSNGTRLWGTYYGGAGDEWDGRIGLAVDPTGAVYLGGTTTSTTDIGFNGHQNTYGGGTRDAFLVKFTSAGARVWGTYYGSDGYDGLGACATDPEGNVYISGGTNSTTGIAWQGFQNAPASSGSSFADDAFLVKFNTAGERLWGTYFGGESDDRACGCATDAAGNVFICGGTVSLTGIAFEGPQSTHGGGLVDAYVARFDPGGMRTWATYFGGPSYEYDPAGYGIATGTNGRVGLVGWTSSESGIAVNGHQNMLNGQQDAYLAVFDGDGATLQTGPLNGQVCVGGPVDIPFTATGLFNPGNIFTAQLSDAGGSFTNPVDIGNLSGTASGTINATIPVGTALGTGYRIRVVASAPATVGEDNGADIVVTEPGAPCDDGDPDTNGDVINGDCACVGAPACSTVGTEQESEPNNDNSQADTLAQGTTISGTIGGCVPTDFSTDRFLITSTGQGALRVVACLSTTGTLPEEVTFEVSISTGFVVASQTLQAGANGEAITDTLDLPCLGTGNYYLAVFAPGLTDCLHYAFSCQTMEPYFGNDPFPNPGVEHDTYQDGRTGFFGEVLNYDLFNIVPPFNGHLAIEVQAERAGTAPGTLQVQLYNTVGGLIQEWIVPTGANGVPDTTTLSAACVGASTDYDVRFHAIDCGASYRWKYTITAPVFANDAEPNNSMGEAVVLPPATPATGQLLFNAGSSGYENDDRYRLDLPVDGVMHVNVEAEHTDPSTTDSVQVGIVQSNGAVLATWHALVGASSLPSNTSFQLPCSGTAVPSYLQLVSGTCGVSYRVSWSMSPAFYSADPEPNNDFSSGIPMDLSASSYDGHLGFHGAVDDDFYLFTHPGGDFSVTVSAEHVGDDEGSMELTVMSSTGAVFGNSAIPVGASSAPLTTTFTVPELPAGSLYSLYLSDVTCGVSYRLHCTTDEDGDGICDAADLCPGGPEPGTPCDDGNAGTVNDAISEDCDCEGDITTGLPGTEAATDDLRLWPNPATDEVWLEVEGGNGTSIQVVVRDMMGRMVIAVGPIMADAQGRLLVDLAGIASGTYLVELRTNDRKWSRRLVKA